MLLAPAPRRVPLSLRIIHSLGHQGLWLLAGFASIFFWTFVANADLSFMTFRAPLRFAAGRVTKVEETSMSESKTKIVANHYEYSVAGQTLKGVSYSLRTGAAQGGTVVVDYKEDDPAQSRIEGMRRHPFGPWVILITLFPAIAIFFLVLSIRKGRRRRRLFEHGIIAMAKLKNRRATNVMHNKRTVYALTFEFTSREGRKHETEVRSAYTDRFEDEAQEQLLYDPGEPSVAYLLDDMPSRPKVDLMGELEPRPLAVMLSLIIPAIVVLANVFALMGKMG